MIAFFPGKFQPPHLGHILTIVNIYNQYEKIIVGVTDGGPSILNKKIRIEMLENAFRYCDKIKVSSIKGILTKYEDIEGLPKFDVCISGNPEVIEKMESLGIKTKYISRSEGPGFSGTEIRSIKTSKSVEFWKNRGNKNIVGHEVSRLHGGTLGIERVKKELILLPKILKPKKMNTILDLGCGTGIAERALYKHVRKITAVDVCEEFIVNQMDKYTNVKYILSDIREFIPSETYDYILLLGVIQYIIENQELINLLNKCKKYLNKRGKLLIRNSSGITDSIIIDKFVEEYGDNYTANYRSLPELIDIASSNGFIVNQVVSLYTKRLDSKYGTRQYYILFEKMEDW